MARVGLVFLPEDAAAAVDLVVRAEAAGVDMAWFEMDATGLDPFALLGAAASRTERIGLGTAIVPVFSRHPVLMAVQAAAVAGLAPGRLRLGVGPGNLRRMAEAFHLPVNRAVSRLREYVQVLRPLLQEGSVRFAGDHYAAAAELPVDAPGTPVLLSALGPQAYGAAGELADGALAWLCPIDYLFEVAAPAMAEGAAAAGRPTPPLVAHVTVQFGDDRARAREGISLYGRVPVFGRMLEAAGYPVVDGLVAGTAVDELVAMGDEDEVAAQLTKFVDRGVDELMVSFLPGTPSREDEDALLRVLAAI